MQLEHSKVAVWVVFYILKNKTKTLIEIYLDLS